MKFSPQESRVANCIRRGLTVKETARELGMGAGTVRSHRGRIYLKLGVNNDMKALLALQAMERGTVVQLREVA